MSETKATPRRLKVGELVHLAQEFRASVPLQDRYVAKTKSKFEAAFVGSEAVETVVEISDLCEERGDAHGVLQALADAGIFFRVGDGEEGVFVDSVSAVYQFQEHDTREDGGEGLYLASKCGYLLKKGKGKLSAYKRRWFVLANDFLFYYAKRSDVHPAGDIPLRDARLELHHHEGEGGGGGGKKKDDQKLTLVTPHRTFHIVAESLHDLGHWVFAIRKVMAKLDRFDTSPTLPPQEEADVQLSIYVRGAIDDLASSFILQAVTQVEYAQGASYDPPSQLLTVELESFFSPVAPILQALESIGMYPVLQ